MSWLGQFFRKKETSSSVAKKRLQMVLVHDRNDISPGLLELIKDDIIQVIVRHLAIDPASVVVNLNQDGPDSFLVAEIPLPGNSSR